MADRPIPVGNAVLCEHVVPGLNGKYTLIGVYSGDVIVSELPAKLFLGVYLEIKTGFEPNTMLVVEVMVDDMVIGKMEAFDRTSSQKGGALVLPQLQIGFERDIEFSVVLKSQGYADTVALRKRISQGDLGATSPTASEQPSSQSPPGAPAT